MSRIPFPGICGPSYQLASKYAAVERCVNWVCTPNETRGEESKYTVTLEPTPGLLPFSVFPVPPPFNQACRGMVYCRDVVYGVNGQTLWSMNIGGGAYTALGYVLNDGQPVQMVATGSGQIFVATQQGNCYVYTIQTASYTDLSVNPNFLGGRDCTFQDGYVIVANPVFTAGAINQIQISGSLAVPVNDATQWDASNINAELGQADFLIAVRSSREYLRLFGAERSQIFYNSGAQNFPFVSYNSTFIEFGTCALQSISDMGDSWIWLGRDHRGFTAAFQDFGFQPTRISTFAVEAAWSQYSSLAIGNARAFSYTWLGHKKYQICFPLAKTLSAGAFGNATWEYDVTASQVLGKAVWTELEFQRYDGQRAGLATPVHCYAYTQDNDIAVHLVGSDGTDNNPGGIYQLSGSTYTSLATDGVGDLLVQPIPRTRITPHLFNTGLRTRYDRFWLETSKGTGLSGSGYGSNPSVGIEFSRDGGNTYGDQYPLFIGKEGQYQALTYLNRCGYARDMVLKMEFSDPCYCSIVNGYWDAVALAS